MCTFKEIKLFIPLSSNCLRKKQKPAKAVTRLYIHIPSAFSMRVYDQRVLFVAQTQNQKKALLNKIVNREKPADFALLVAGYGEVQTIR